MIEAVFQSWKPDPWLVGILLFLSWIYARGWGHLNRHFPRRFSIARLVSFYSGLVLFFIATASPLDAFSGLLLTAHMIQHLLLMMLIPPLILLGAPYLPLLRGLPRNVRIEGLGPFLRWHGLQQLGSFLTHPLVCLLSFMMTTVIWHLPALYELALRSKSWHDVEHACFLFTGVLFWWPVIQPWPAKAHWPRWAMIPYLLIADLQNTALSAFLLFYDRVIYPSYAAVPRLFGMSVLEDQAAAGSIMWVPGSIVYLIPVGLITIKLLSSKRTAVQPSQLHAVLPITRAAFARKKEKGSGWDLLLVPFLGRLFRHRHFRRAMQTILFALAIGVIIDGLLGPSMSPLNLAGVLPWIHWRGFVVIALLVAGNLFCMACPFMLTRDLGRRFLPARWRWPKALRSKWMAVALLALYLWAYEAFSLWNSPQWTAWIMIGYFVTAFLIDGLFQGASFCKYVCPIGQYNFVQSLVSPLEVKVRSLDVCKNCKTYDCIRGNSVDRGCELQLFQPKKAGSLDCTFCLDCVHACPHNNVGILAVVPGSQLLHDRYRSSLGRLTRRVDLAALVLLLVFGAFVNAAGMVSPVATWEQGLQHKFGLQSLLPVTTVLFLLGLVFVPGLLAIACGEISRILSGIRIRRKELLCSLALSLIPLGFSMWLVHLLFHISTGAWTAVPIAQRALLDLGINLFGQPNWMMPSVSGPLQWMTSVQLLLLNCGLLLTLYVGWRIAQRYTPRRSRALGMAAPWACLTVFLYIVGVWIVFQPMQMRGMMMH